MANEGEKLSELATLIASRLEDIAVSKNQREIAEEVGFPNKNMISIIKSGGTKLSIDRVEVMAKALGLDLAVLMLPALRQYYSEDTIDALRKTFDSTETKTERDIVALARKHMDVNKPLSYQTREALKEVFASNRPTGT